MKNNKIKLKAFTLIEILISITILSIIMISVIQIFIHSTWVTSKSDINRIMQENIKNVMSHVSEDIRKQWISWTSVSIWWNCDMINNTWSKLCLKSSNEYYLSEWAGDYNIRSNRNFCSLFENTCTIVKKNLNNWEVSPLTNSFVAIKDLEFTISNDVVPKATINIVMQPAVKKWFKTDIIKENKLIFQTTISERPF